MSQRGGTFSKNDDVTLLHAAAMAVGVRSTLAPNRVLMLRSPAGDREICIAQGVPPSTSQATAAILSDQVVARQVLQGADLPVPRWRDVRFVDGEAEIAQAATEVGYPVLLRAGWGGRQATTSSIVVRVPTGKELLESVQTLQGAAGPRAMRPRQPRGHFMVEELVPGTPLRALVCDGDVLGVAQEDETDHTSADVELSTLHPDVLRLIRNAARSLPDLGVAGVRVSVEDHTASLARQHHAVTALDMYPGLTIHERAAPGAWRRLAATLLDRFLGTGDEPGAVDATDVQRRLIGHGLADSAKAGAALASYIERHDVNGEVANRSKDGMLEATLEGDLRSIATLADAFVEGRVGRSRPLYVELQSMSGKAS